MCNVTFFGQQLCVERLTYSERSWNGLEKALGEAHSASVPLQGGAGDPKVSSASASVFASFQRTKSAEMHFFLFACSYFENGTLYI